ncbi:LCP family protein [Saxibacter everestensis]|uniref:LCP family protein n=1 Tax=Saxibacter everestensis TaxID=2909229 RepID=A0ABY8QZF4_9MICO|nr:LCP family protein [Brevibacteriaceae bacterium ZFBP1038]
MTPRTRPDQATFDELVDGSADNPPADDWRERNRRKKRRNFWVAVAIFVALILVGLAIVGGYLWNLSRSVSEKATYVENVLPDSKDRPEASKVGSKNILFLGSDKRPEDSGEKVTGQRSDVMMLVHIDSARQNAYAVSFPRDLWVPIPGHGKNKINSALAFGGLPLAAQTVENFTDTRIDHVAMIDFEGFAELTDSLGGVEVDVEESFSSAGFDFTAGTQKLSGEEALAFVRERKSFKDGDFQRVRNQQAFLRGLMKTALSGDTLTSPGKINDLVSTVAPYLTVDKGFDPSTMAGLGWDLRNVRPANIHFLQAPNDGTGRAGKASIVKVDDGGMDDLRKALKDDTMEEYAANAG